MDNEHTDTDEQETPAPNPRTALLIGLGGLTVIAVILLAVRADRSSGRSTVSYDIDYPIDGTWESSMQHLADAVAERMGNLEARVDGLATERVRAAATSEPPVPLIPQPDPIAANGAAQAAHVSDTVADVPAPAAVSLPDA